MRLSLFLALLAALFASAAQAQSVGQAGPWSAGHLPVYSSPPGGQPFVGDSGPAGGSPTGPRINEQMWQAPQTQGGGLPPYANSGTGPYGTNVCDYDGPITSVAGYHYLCLSANADGGGLLAFGAGGAASQEPLYFVVNGTKYSFPFTSGYVIGPGVSTVGDVVCWNNLVGTLQSDCGPFPVSPGTSGEIAYFAANGSVVSGTATGANIISALANAENGSGALVGTTSPSLVTPALGTVASGNVSAASTTGTGATASPTLASRATDSGVTFNLKNDFGAKCDGSTDDTIPIQNWLNKATANVRLIAPAGTCEFSAHLAAPLSNGWSLTGAGQGATIFQYTGPNYNGTVAAGASWSAAAATITLSSATIPAAITAALAASLPVYVLDTQGVGSSVSSPSVIGTVATIVGTTLTLNAGATVASQGTGDSLLLQTDVLTIGGTSASTKNVTLSGFTLASTTSLTGGFMLHAHDMVGGAVNNITAGSFPSGVAVSDIAGGFWFDGAAGVYTYNLFGNGSGIGDGLLVNGAQGGNGDMMVNSPSFLFFANGLHQGGTFGGLQCDGAGDIRLNGTDLLIDNAVTASANFDFEKNGGCAFDGGIVGDNILINDTKTIGGFNIVLNGWLGASWYGSTVNVEKCSGCLIYMNGILASLSCQDGIYIQDQSVSLSISVGSQIRGNGANGTVHSGQPLGNGTCVTASGRGHGILSTTGFAKLFTNIQPVSNLLSAFGNIEGYATTTPPVSPSVSGGTVVVGNGSSWDVTLENNAGQLALGVPTGTKTIKLSATYTVSGLPTCNAAATGSQTFVSDATVRTPGIAPTGSGGLTVPVYCDGSVSAWYIQ